MSRAEDTLAVCSVRYALGRMTYVVSDVIEAVTPIDLSENSAVVIARDVARALREGRAGMDCDARQWDRFLSLLTARWPAAVDEIRRDSVTFPGIATAEGTGA